jgi:3-methyladenine DNA glycosylase AlkD
MKPLTVLGIAGLIEVAAEIGLPVRLPTIRAMAQKADASVSTATGLLKVLRTEADPRMRANMGARFGITGPTADTAFGVPVGRMRTIAKQVRGPGRTPQDAVRNHALAEELWATGQYEARFLASFIGEPSLLTARMMDRWAKEFDNWAVCDTCCFCLFDRADDDLVFGRINAWAGRREEFVKRAAFALLASAALHRKELPDANFLESLSLIERHAGDERNFVKKGVSWGLRAMKRRGPVVRAAAVKCAERLIESENPHARWVGRDALRDLTGGAAPKKKTAKKVRPDGGAQRN